MADGVRETSVVMYQRLAEVRRELVENSDISINDLRIMLHGALDACEVMTQAADRMQDVCDKIFARLAVVTEARP
jgi:hypothetical protein